MVKPKRTVRRPRLQYSLRALLALTLLVSALCSWGAVRLRRASRQERAVKTIQDLGGYVLYDYEFDSSGAYKLGRRLRVPQLLQDAFGVDVFAHVVYVVVGEDNFGPTRMTDSAMQGLTSLPRLRVLVIMHSQGVTDAGLVHLKELRELEELELSGTSITDAGLAHLGHCTRIRRLDLFRTRITDAGLPHLYTLEKLRDLSLLGTDVTNKGVKRLRERLPKADIDL